MSLSEHFCNNCFDNFYRPSKDGNVRFNNWCHEWGSVAKASKPTLKAFVASELLPYWIKCTQRQCGKWRKVCGTDAIDPEFIKKFKCRLSDSKSCDAVEDNDVALVLDSTFMYQVAEKPLLKNSPAAPYLRRFLFEDIGICPINSSKSPLKDQKFIEPFLMEQCGESSIWVKPGMIDEDEIAFAKRVDVSTPTYFGLRNLIVAVWNLTPSEWLTIDKIHQYLVCRGLVRIYLISVAEQITELLTKKAVINHGIILNPALKLLKKAEDAPKVLVIGAGVSGLAAANHLRNLGVKVSVFEADSDIGGRVKDVPSLGMGAFLVQGLKNNPFTTLAIQAKTQFQILEEDFVVFKPDGELIPDDLFRETKRHLDNLFQGALESAAENKDESLSFRETLEGNRKKIGEVTSYLNDPDVFNNLLSLKEIKMQANLGHLSPLGWECPTAVQGEEGFLPNGLRLLLIKLSKDLDVHLSHQVKSIDYTGDKVIVKTTQSEAEFSKVIITVPLSVLQSERIEFDPSLPDSKKKAIGDLGDCYLEKLILEFPEKFWNKDNKKSFSKFGVLSQEKIFEVFVDVTGKKDNSIPTLVAYISEKTPDYLENRADKEVVDECMMLLKGVFGKSTSNPSKWFVTRWKDRDLGGGYGSYIKKGSEMSAYDNMTASVDDKLYFAGEATFRNMPSTVAGAYLSGLREAAKIVKDLEL